MQQKTEKREFRMVGTIDNQDLMTAVSASQRIGRIQSILAKGHHPLPGSCDLNGRADEKTSEKLSP
ncbi:MAG: hypothetical protein WBC04_25340 [Candidatus Acidiferrales bacterium]